MLAGHYSAALVAKAAAPRVPLWSLFAAAQLVDIAFALLVLAGVEHLRFDTSLQSNPLDLYYIPYTHSLPATFAWALSAYLAGRAWLGDSRAALALAGVTASHWFLDLLVHRPDLPLWGDAHKVGLALWDRPALAWWTELAFIAVAGFALWRSAALAPAGRRRVAWLVAVLVLLHLVSLSPLPTSSPAVFVCIGLALYGGLAAIAWRLEPSERR
jgi:membrane-bound metal-dependent hydrolase YbcI (DUF457 family)